MPLLSKASKDEFDSPVKRLLASIANLRQQPTSKGAHFFRTSLRRFEAWSDIFHPRTDADQKRALKFLEKLQKTAGKLRDSDVHLELLDKLSSAGSAEKKKIEKALASRRKSYEKRLKLMLRDPILTGTWRTLRVLDEAPPEPGEPPVVHPIAGMADLALEEYRAFGQRRGTLSPENLHEYRLACKRFRYTAELAGHDPKGKQLVDAWKEVQDLIGDWHDCLLLAELAEETLGDSAVHSAIVELTHRKFAAAKGAVEKVEMKWIGSRNEVPKKEPGRARSGRRSSRAA